MPEENAITDNGIDQDRLTLLFVEQLEKITVALNRVYTAVCVGTVGIIITIIIATAIREF